MPIDEIYLSDENDENYQELPLNLEVDYTVPPEREALLRDAPYDLRPETDIFEEEKKEVPQSGTLVAINDEDDPETIDVKLDRGEVITCERGVNISQVGDRLTLIPRNNSWIVVGPDHVVGVEQAEFTTEFENPVVWFWDDDASYLLDIDDDNPFCGPTSPSITIYHQGWYDIEFTTEVPQESGTAIRYVRASETIPVGGSGSGQLQVWTGAAYIDDTENPDPIVIEDRTWSNFTQSGEVVPVSYDGGWVICESHGLNLIGTINARVYFEDEISGNVNGNLIDTAESAVRGYCPAGSRVRFEWFSGDQIWRITEVFDYVQHAVMYGDLMPGETAECRVCYWENNDWIPGPDMDTIGDAAIQNCIFDRTVTQVTWNDQEVRWEPVGSQGLIQHGTTSAVISGAYATEGTGDVQLEQGRLVSSPVSAKNILAHGIPADAHVTVEWKRGATSDLSPNGNFKGRWEITHLDKPTWIPVTLQYSSTQNNNPLYNVKDAWTGATLMSNVNPTTAPHEWRRSSGIDYMSAQVAWAQFDGKDYILKILPEVPGINDCTQL